MKDFHQSFLATHAFKFFWNSVRQPRSGYFWEVTRRLLLPLALLLAGCGGGGTTRTNSNGLSRVTIDWPAQTRGFEGSPLAGSAIVRFERTDSLGENYSFPVVRPTGSDAVSQSYTLPDKVRAGYYRLTVHCCSGADSQPSNVVGYGRVNVVVLLDGTVRDENRQPLGDIDFTSGNPPQ